MELIVLAVLGIILGVLSLFILMRKIESAIFYSILLGPAIGSSLGGFLINLFAGDMLKAVESFKFLPFFLAPVDEAFFGAGNQLLMVVGAVIFGLWVYVLLHFLSGKFGIWSLPIILPVIWVAGMSLPNIRLRLAEILPFLSFLFETLYGLPFILSISALIGVLCFLYYRRTHSHDMDVVLPERLRLKS